MCTSAVDATEKAPDPAPLRARVPLPLTLFVLFGALLTFVLEPMVGRLLLPSCGGGAHVWTTCMMFFQGALCLGYLQCHLVAPRLRGWQLLVYLLPLPFLPLATLLVSPDPASPVTDVLVTLVRHVAVPFAALSTTAVVAQQWLARSGAAEPYPLYAASNWGSLLGLFMYPLLLEPLLSLRTQRWAWSAAYLGYLLLALLAYPRGAGPAGPAPEAKPAPAPAPPLGTQAAWFFLALAPSAFLLAVTNAIAADVGSAPMVWVLPLGLYLLSFVLAFGRLGRPWVIGRFWIVLAALGLVTFASHRGGVTWIVASIHLCTLFGIAWAAHGELVLRRPASEHLARFYLTIALGGWGGGVLVSMVAPAVFSGVWEYPLSLGLLAAVFLALHGRGILRALADEHAAVVLVTLLGLSWCGAKLIEDALTSRYTPRLQLRNTYGIHRVIDELENDAGRQIPFRRLYHGTTVHGGQVQGDLSQRRRTVSYYHPAGPLGDAMRVLRRPAKAAIIGLGSGGCAGWFGAGDELTFYELDPDTVRIAREQFTYLSDLVEVGARPARIVLGDARLQLAADPEAPPGGYDLILIDAFSSDAIPTHLLTREAVELYLSRLAPDGWLLFHISNRYYDLRPVVRAVTRDTMVGVWRARRTTVAPLEFYADWYALRRTAAGVEPLATISEWRSPEGLPELAPWTDDHVNLFPALWLKVKDRMDW